MHRDLGSFVRCTYIHSNLLTKLLMTDETVEMILVKKALMMQGILCGYPLDSVFYE